jgi:hypothetical protein
LEAVIPGDRELERQLHDRFAPHRLKGEWFAITDELEGLIRDASLKDYEAASQEDAPHSRRESDEELAEKSLALERRLFAEAARDFESVEWHPVDVPPPPPKSYVPAPVSGGKFADHYAVRHVDSGRLLCVELGLTRDQSDLLCDVLEAERAAQGRQITLPIDGGGK